MHHKQKLRVSPLSRQGYVDILPWLTGHMCRRCLIFGFFARSLMHLHKQMHPVVVHTQFLDEEAVVGDALDFTAFPASQFAGYDHIESTPGISTLRRLSFECQESGPIVFFVGHKHFGHGRHVWVGVDMATLYNTENINTFN